MTIDRRTAIGLFSVGALALPDGALALAAPADDPGFVADGLTVEWRHCPLGIDTLRPRFGWRLAARALEARALHQGAWQLVIGDDANSVGRGKGAIWDSGVTVGAVQRAQPAHVLSLTTHRRYWWAVRVADRVGRWSPWSASASFVMGVVSPEQWPTHWIAAGIDRTLPPHAIGQASPAMVPAEPLPLLRRRLALAAKPRRAMVSVCGLGQYRLAINGASVGATALTPGWTNYRRTVFYDTNEVTGQLAAGENVLAVLLGNGMYNVEHKNGRYTKFLDSFGRPKAILLLTIEHQDGSIERLTTDQHWRWIEGPIRFSSIYGGEDWDARLLPPGWDEPGFDDRAWHPVELVDGPGGVLRGSSIPPVVVAEKLAPVAITEPTQGVLLVDFGVNFAGRPAIDIEASAGTALVALPGEALDAQGRVSQRSFNAGPGNAVEFGYVAAGRGIERFEPAFTYHGFRYLELTGLPPAAIKAAVGLVLHTEIDRVGSFDAGPPLLGQIHRLIDQAVTSNIMSVLTDCPHREKLGWLEQTYLNAPTVLYNRDAITLYEKLLRDIGEAQQPNGMVPGIAPEYVAFIDAAGRDQIWRNSPEWGAAAILAPWSAYRFYGDAAILKAAYPAAERYCAYLISRSQDGLIDFGMGDWYDVGPKEPGESQLTSRALVGSAIHIEMLKVMARVARLVGRAGAVADYRARAAAVAARLNASFLDPATGRYERGSQTAQAMPLALNLVPGTLRTRALALLVAAIRREGNGVTAGDIGFRYVIDALAAAGRDDVVLDMLNVSDRPSYAMQIARGATALTEAWDGNPTKSLNHFMLGHAEGWLYSRLAGLDVDHARGRDAALRIAPQILRGVDRAAASYRLSEGLLASRWQIDGDTLHIDVEVPPGRQAMILVPTDRPATLRDGAVPIALAEGIIAQQRVPGGVTLTASSGRYRLSAERSV